MVLSGHLPKQVRGPLLSPIAGRNPHWPQWRSKSPLPAGALGLPHASVEAPASLSHQALLKPPCSATSGSLVSSQLLSPTMLALCWTTQDPALIPVPHQKAGTDPTVPKPPNLRIYKHTAGGRCGTVTHSTQLIPFPSSAQHSLHMKFSHTPHPPQLFFFPLVDNINSLMRNLPYLSSRSRS